MKKILLVCGILLSMISLAQDGPHATAMKAATPPAEEFQWKEATSGGYAYRYIPNDPTKTRFYKMKNGLTVMLSVNKKEPRIRTLMAVRAGSNSDPADHTGLAHYLEHLLFKGTDKLGSKDWQKEKPLLDKMDSLYEVYNKTTDPQQRKDLYRIIDETSGEAAKYAIANEYSKAMKDMGGQATNAHTSLEETVYEEYIPSNSLDKYLALQTERFRQPILRIFHTELEAVYEEKNRTLDNDGRKLQQGMFSNVFPTTNYGLQSTIGTIEHLKNPSLLAIKQFYNTYYVPNNLGFIMSGDFNPDEAIKKIDTAFAFMQPKPFPEYNAKEITPLSGPVVKEIFGPASESVRICYRTPEDLSKDAMMLTLISNILSNQQAGLIDLDLNKQQKVLSAFATLWQFKNHGMIWMSANPKQGQTLEEAKDLLMGEIEKLKKGEFDEGLILASVNNAKLGIQQNIQNNISRANLLSDNFIRNKGEKWNEYLASFELAKSVTKKEVVEFANKFFGDNYVVLYKRKGDDKSIQKVDKPQITPLVFDKTAESPMFKSITGMPSAKISPEWVDFKTMMKTETKDSRTLLYTPNVLDRQFRLTYYFEMGSFNDKKLAVAADYLNYLGTKNISSENISKEFYKLACSFSINTNEKTTGITISGLEENFTAAVSLFENLVKNCVADSKALEEYKGRLIKSRANNKTSRLTILSAMTSYAQYGADNPFRYGLTNKEINELSADELTSILHHLTDYKHKVLYYGPQEMKTVSAEIKKLHPAPATALEYPSQKVFTEQPTTSQVYFTDYDMVQAEMQWVRNAGKYDPYNQALVNVYNSYFGNGGSSFVYQVIRETKALAYSTFAVYSTSGEYEKQNSIIGYVGSQADKFNDATKALNELFSEFPVSEKAFIAAKTNVLNVLETQRISQDAILNEYIKNKRLGIEGDIRKTTYENIQKLTLEDLRAFHAANFAGKPFTLLVLASDKKISKADMEKIAPVKQLSLEELFGY